jgi:hypothetical protein
LVGRDEKRGGRRAGPDPPPRERPTARRPVLRVPRCPRPVRLPVARAPRVSTRNRR